MTTWRLNRKGEQICNAHAIRKNAYGNCSACERLLEDHEIERNIERDFENAMMYVDGPVYDALRAIWDRLDRMERLS